MKTLRHIYGISEDPGFSFIKGNRVAPDPKHINKLREIMKNNIEVDPIIVDLNTKGIIDGQHRYLAAMSLWEDGFPYVLPVDFRKFDNPLMAALTYNNSRKNWTTSDYVNAYIEDGRTSYKRLYDFVHKYEKLCERNHPQYTLALEIIRIGKVSDIRKGDLQLTNYDIDKAEHLFEEILRVYYAIPNNSRERFLKRNIVTSWIKARDFILSKMYLDKYLSDLTAKFVTPETDIISDWEQSFVSIINK